MSFDSPSSGLLPAPSRAPLQLDPEQFQQDAEIGRLEDELYEIDLAYYALVYHNGYLSGKIK